MKMSAKLKQKREKNLRKINYKKAKLITIQIIPLKKARGFS